MTAAASSWADERDLKPGHVIGQFELIGLVGRGGMARVWAARDQRTGSLCALKMLRAHLAENADFRDMFFDEARIASRIHHANVATTHELLDLDGVLTLVMELVDGPSLVRLIRPGSAERDDAPRIPIPPRVAARIIAETCAGLHAAHELRDDAGRPLGVVHRDVSPHNILVDSAGHVKVTDFGVAKAFGKSHQTLAGTIKGKLAYMSPEQLAGGGIDRRSDVFALGALLYEMTVGQRAFDGENDPEVMRAILGGEPTPPSRLVANYPPGLEQIVMRALAHGTDARWPTARHMQESLEGFLLTSGPPVGVADVAELLTQRTGRRGLAPAPPSLGDSRPLPDARLPEPPYASGTRKRSIEQRTSWVTVLLGMMVGLTLGLVVLRSVYLTRKSNAAAETPVPRSTPSAIPTGTVTAEIDEIASARRPPSTPPGSSSSRLETAPPRPSAPRQKPSNVPLPPNPYE